MSDILAITPEGAVEWYIAGIGIICIFIYYIIAFRTTHRIAGHTLVPVSSTQVLWALF
jgi:hypothetical protein